MSECVGDGVRLRVVSYTAQCVRVVCSVSGVALFVSGALHEDSPHWLVPARVPKGETSQISWAKASGCSPFSTNAQDSAQYPRGWYST